MAVTESSTSDKLVYDEKTGRFYERTLEEVCEDEFCLVDSSSGDLILLTKVICSYSRYILF